ncbi:MAG: class I SAM-dependent methyltransferase [Gammaproteobacteria bacterium]|nr:class I SAM-dependent methyltransferase [Gammaproteobacteria bacterium]
MSAGCRFCGHPLATSFADLGTAPLSNAFLRPERRLDMEPHYPLHAYVCEQCFLVQLEQYAAPEQIFDDYVYFSSYSRSWLEHARRYSEAMISDLGLGPASFVTEIASNDGYLLRNFVDRGIPCLGVEPAHTVAMAAREHGVPTIERFFDEQTADRIVADHGHADLIVANNVLAHVPDLNGFVRGCVRLLAPRGLLTVEVPHLLRLVQDVQFDTIYHEHFSYFSLATAVRVFAAYGLEVTDVEELDTHGGSLRLHVRAAATGLAPSAALAKLLARERTAGLLDTAVYRAFQARVDATKRDLLEFLITARRAGKHVVGYGAAAKGNTLFNYCGIRTDFIDFVVDRNPHKQGLLLPGSHIPVRDPDAIDSARPDYVLVLPWNLIGEIRTELARIGAWGGALVVAIPRVAVLS